MKSPSKKIRVATVGGILLFAAIGFLANLEIGTMSAIGYRDIFLLCPLGALSAMIATRTIIPHAVISLVIAVALMVLFARAFCAWICPVPLVEKLRDIFSVHQTRRKKKSEKNSGEHPFSGQDAVAKSASIHRSEKTLAMPLAGEDDSLAISEDLSSQEAQISPDEAKALKHSCSGNHKSCSGCETKKKAALDSRHLILGGSLLSTAIFGFPVFCLICPIGLTFGTIVLLVNLFSQGDLNRTLIIAPLFLIIEVVLFRKWCSKICPLSAMMSLVGKLNRTFVPQVDKSQCMETKDGIPCGLCEKVCPEGIDIKSVSLASGAWSECTKCRDCIDVCPSQAVSMPFLPKKNLQEEVKKVEEVK